MVNMQAAGELRGQLAAEAGAREAAERRAAKLQSEAGQAAELRARLKRLEDSLQARVHQGRLFCWRSQGHMAVGC